MPVFSTDNLYTTLTQIDQQLADMTANPKPSYGIDGKSVQWGEHFRNLLEARKQIIDAIIQAEGPYEHIINGAS
jgi:hypothetical protein